MKTWKSARSGLSVLVDVVRESEFPDDIRVFGPSELASYYRILQKTGFIPKEREAFVVFLLNSKNKVIGAHIVSVGTIDGSMVHPREVFRPAIAVGAATIVVAHHHPSGDKTPSQQDKDITDRLQKAGELIGIEVLDHIIIGGATHYSFAEQR
jgi:DNA repair protein RadC